jgi:two-component system, sporulation sensor kinase D
VNLYSNKQKWKIALLFVAILLVGVSLFFSNQIVSKVSEKERERVKQWADAIKKKAELVRLTNGAFSRLREKERKEMELWIEATKEISKPVSEETFPDYTLPLKIIDRNKDIPVILFDQEQTISGFINLDFDTSYFSKNHPDFNKKQVTKAFEDSLRKLAVVWKAKNPAFTIEVFEGLFMTYAYNDSKNIFKLEQERDSLINAFNNELISNQNLVPVLLIDKESDSIIATNIPKLSNTSSGIKKTIAQFKKINQPIEIVFSSHQNSLLYYDNSPELVQLQYFPYIQFVIIGLFIFIGYLIFSTFRKAEQNQVWAGMAKETAHQLGTPLSSLMAWNQLLENEQIDQNIVIEMKKDIDRLETVTNRFSKIGSDAKLDPVNIVSTIEHVVEYLKHRISSKIDLRLESTSPSIILKHNPPLMEWVVENIVKNAVDAIDKTGEIVVYISETDQQVIIDIKDSGKGMSSKQIASIFQPGFTTKKRGWGLGLSLVKRIVTEYHHGKIFVAYSEPNKGTTFRILLKK